MLKTIPLVLLASTALADGAVTDNIRISSDVLGYDLQYRVYLPESVEDRTELPVLYLTDGHTYLSRGQMRETLDREIGAQQIEPLIAVFVDPRDPDNLSVNRRNSQFLCNSDYLRFFVEELIPAVEKNFPVRNDREARTIMGLSFGATNAACFGMLGSDQFSGLAMQSPANHPLPDLLPAYERSPLLPLNIFLSTGKPDDNTTANRRFHTVLKDKGYDVNYVEVRQGHDWQNWRPLLDDVLRYFYGTEKPD
jgi:enterochelin esterase-like enzyme